MHEIQSGFLETICADPDDDAPRLVYADWLDEHGQEARAEFIRAQVELARLEVEDSASQAIYEFLYRFDARSLRELDWELIDPGVARRLALEMRCFALLHQHEEAWSLAETPRRCGLAYDGMHRGFFAIGEISGTKVFPRQADRLRRQVPLTHLNLFDRRRAPALSQVGTLLESGWLPQFRSLSIGGSSAERVIEALSSSPQVSGVQQLYCTSRNGNAVAGLIANSPHWSGLQTLRLGWDLASDTVRRLLEAPHLKGLVTLRGEWAKNCDATAIQALADAEWTSLRHLDLESGLDDESAAILANCKSLQRLRTLDLCYGNITGRGISALIGSPVLQHLTVLDSSGRCAGRLDVDLLQTKRSDSLRVLSLSRDSEVSLSTIAESPALQGLIWLRVHPRWVNDHILESLSGCSGLKRLAVLDLGRCQVDDRGAQALAALPALANVRRLHLRGNNFGEIGAQALANSPYLNRVRHLCVDRRSIGKVGLTALRQRFGDAVDVSDDLC